jgi:parallel beta-helix repeat protein
MHTTTLFPHFYRQATFAFASAFAFGLLLTSTALEAKTYCVANATQLQDALDGSSDGGMSVGEFNQINIVRGTYKTGTATANGAFHYHDSTSTGYLYLQGGWNTGCTTRRFKAAQTVLDGNSATQVLSLRQATHEIDVSALTIQNGETTRRGGGVEINNGTGDNSRVVFTGNIIRNNHTTNADGGLYIASGADIVFVENNVIADNSADGGNGAGAVVSFGVGAVYNNTVTRNTTTLSGGTGGLYFIGSNNGFVVNNIFWSNTAFGIYLGSANVRLDYNDYGTQGGFAPSTNIGCLSNDPKFVDAAGGDFHLTGRSSLLGTTNSPSISGIDPDGNASATSGRGDMGAYNETIFMDGVDGD